MEVEHCLFPDDLLYDPEENVWVMVADDVIVLGILHLRLHGGKATFIEARTRTGASTSRGNS